MPKYVDKYAVVDVLHNSEGNKSEMIENVLQMPKTDCIPLDNIKRYLDSKFCVRCCAKSRCKIKDKRCALWQSEYIKII